MNPPIDQLLGPLNDIEQKNAPAQLFAQGDASLLRRNPRVAVVGSRNASPAGIERARKLVEDLVELEAVIVSGLARGVDAAAHSRAIERGGKTIAVLGTPLNQYAVMENRKLQDRIAAEHLLVSQFPPGARVYPSNFPTRNRTMALICQASVIVEAGDGSGTLSQGWEALRLGRPLFLYEEVVANSALEWPAKMLAYGAVVFDGDVATLAEVLPPAGQESHAHPF
jgi:DNA processing protein